ncbi:hypothetical protein Pmar_PMAR012579 [Perkinsus marinus ATCC 50983]|uniref:Uncharacterized protein n=1 Tax=Perkinsus marinus (strain ATCC 50983 / TXsc) TaxID=423536 RepID=C5K7R2_PERM5|nr:hypothetical protein Pmar_PMAR012579 [Perkinsus marinus ATCC 50983]EER19597.1 hypothetical protein Pmar_PMAR012579 [Perkinsus marinus ATCC 50983]|eukprot:XP_002787801.1 hypothetical protein Pmar_PMAR012579 [Perkinsus marinus ATCC 50983]
MVRHSVQRPHFSIKVFTLEEVKSITQFAVKTFFAHFLLYMYMGMPQRQLVVRGFPSEVGKTSVTHEEFLKQQECYDFAEEQKPTVRELPNRVKDAIELYAKEIMNKFDRKMDEQETRLNP